MLGTMKYYTIEPLSLQERKQLPELNDSGWQQLLRNIHLEWRRV